MSNDFKYTADDWQLLPAAGRQEAAIRLNAVLQMFRTQHGLGVPTGLLLTSVRRMMEALPAELGAMNPKPVGFCICAIAHATGLDTASLWVRWSRI